MSSLFKVTGLTKSFGSSVIVGDLDLEIEDGEFLVLLGPSGCGKTTTLRCLAGLETPERGSIEFGDRVVFDKERRIDVPTHKRNLGMVFQSYALWPNMTVRQNIQYPLKVRKIKAAIAGGAVDRAAEMVDCGHLLDRYPSQLSGGQQQRIAVARGLVAEPDLILFDEPLSNLDARLRDQVRTQIHQLHKSLGFTAVFVTHDQSEAFALGDRLAIMREGAIEQYATPQQVFESPATEYVAAFIGMSNRVEIVAGADGWTTADGAAVRVERDVIDHTGAAVRIRPEDISVHRPGDVPAGPALLPASLLAVEYGGLHLDVTMSSPSGELHARVPSHVSNGWLVTADRGSPLVAGFDPGRASIFSADVKARRSAVTVS